MSFPAAESLAEQIARHLASRIIEGELRSGERIQEARVVNELDVSRGSVREALLLLESRHLIHILPRRGAVVAQLTEQHVHSLYDLYVNLLIMLAQKVAQHWNEQNIRPLLEQMQRIQDLSVASGAKTDFIEAGFALMQQAFAVAGNPYLAQLLTDLQPAIHRTYALAVRHSPGETAYASRFFAGLMDAVLKRAPQNIPAVVETYGQHQRALVLAALAQEQTHAS